MIFHKLKKFRAIIENVFSLSILNALNVLLPLITLPYVLRVIGDANYGTYAFVYALISYYLLISNYGFNFSATKQIAQNKGDIEKVNVIYNSVVICRLLLFLLGALIFSILVLLLLDTYEEKFLFFMGIGIVLGDVLNPIWFYQGIEKMRYITIINIVSKTFFTIMIFVFIRTASDYQYLTLINSGGFILAGVLSSLIAKVKFKIKFFIPKLNDIIYQFKEGAVLFGSTVGTNLYGNANVFILNFFVSKDLVGIYAAAEKIIKTSQIVTTPVLQALFPHISKEFALSTIDFQIKRIKQITITMFLLFIIPNLLIYFGADILVRIIAGPGFESSVLLLKIMSPIFTIGALSYTLGIIGLVNLGKQKVFLMGVFISGLVSVLFLVITAPRLGVYAGSIAMTLSEIVLFAFCLIQFYRIKYGKID